MSITVEYDVPSTSTATTAPSATSTPTAIPTPIFTLQKELLAKMFDIHVYSSDL